MTETNEILQSMKSRLTMIKSLDNQQADDQFYKLMSDAEINFQSFSTDMAFFYFQYADFLLRKMERNVDIFNTGNLPRDAFENAGLNEVPEEQQEGSENGGSVKSQGGAINDGGFIQYLDADVAIINDGQKPALQKVEKSQYQQKQQKNDEKQAAKSQNNEEEEGDDEICGQNLQFALQIYLSEKDNIQKGQKSKYSVQEINKLIMKVRARLGDLHVLCQRFKQAIDQFREVVRLECLFPKFEQCRRLAETHYMIGNAILYENKQDSEERAIEQFIFAVNILVNHMKADLPADYPSEFPLPSKFNSKVDRFAYLPKPNDKEYTIELKDVISCLLDKIQDTHAQIAIRKQYQAEKERVKQLQNGNKIQTKSFDQLSQGKKVVNLGVFGNRKRVPEMQNNSNEANVNVLRQAKNNCNTNEKSETEKLEGLSQKDQNQGCDKKDSQA